MMDYSPVSRRRFFCELKSVPDSKMAKSFHLPIDSFESSVLTPQRDTQFSASLDSDGISSLSEREAKVSPYINTDSCLNKHSSSTSAQQNLLTAVTSNMNEAFIVTPLTRSQNSCNKSLSCTPNGKTGPETYETFCKFNEISSELPGREGELSSSDISCQGSGGKGCISLSSGEMVVRSKSFRLEEQSLIAISSLEDSSVSPAMSCSSTPNLLSAALPDVCKAATERETRESMAHPSLGVTFTQANSVENLTEENDTAAFGSHVPMPSESALFMTFICETPTDETEQAKSCGEDAGLLPQVSEDLTQELGKTFMFTQPGMQDSDDCIQTSTPVQGVGNKIPSLSYVSPCIDNVISPGVQLKKRQQFSVTSKRRPVVGITPSICKVKKTEIQKGPKSALDPLKSKDSARMPQQPAAPISAKPQKSLQVNKQSDVIKTTFRIAASKVMGRNMTVSSISKTADSVGKVIKRAATMGLNVKSLRGLDALSSDPNRAPNEHVTMVPSIESSSEGMQASSSQVSEESGQHASSHDYSSANKSSAGNGQVNPKPTPKKDALNRTWVNSGSASVQDRPSVGTMRPRVSSESLSISRPPKEKKAAKVATTSFTVCRQDSVKTSNNPRNPKFPSQHKHVEETSSPADTSRGVKKISLVAEPSKANTTGVQMIENKGLPSPKRGRGTPLPKTPSASSRPTSVSARPKPIALGKVLSRFSRAIGKTQIDINSKGSHRAQASEEPSVGNKLQQNAFKPPQTPTRSSIIGPPPSPAVRALSKIPGLSQDSRSTPVSGVAAHKQTPFKSISQKARLISTPARNRGPAVTTACRSVTTASKGSSSSAVSPPKKTNYGRAVGQTSGATVDKDKAKSSSRQHQQLYLQPTKSTGSRTAAQRSVLEDGGREQNIQQLKELLTASNSRFQALAIVLQQTLAERDEATRQCRKLSQELVSLKGELACTVHSSACLEREKEELRAALQDATQRLHEEHKRELAELKQKLQTAYKAERDNVHITYQEEANKYKAVVQQQMNELKANNEAMKLQLESSHAEQLQSVRRQHEVSLEELRNVHTQELQSFEQAQKDTQAALSAQIQQLSVEKKVLLEKLAAEGSRRTEAGENTQKDSHTLYLEQELDSLNVVLELKNQQLHQQEKKLMVINKLTEKNVKLEEVLIKVQQENEDLKARMDRHATLSRQLSTEQAVLQESLQKESKVNKRLSMENEELLWKLHNGDVNSPRRVSPSPTSPPHPFRLQSPRSSGFFSSPPVSPR